jgi:hypothetical protein
LVAILAADPSNRCSKRSLRAAIKAANMATKH